MDLRDQARADARALLARTPTFRQLSQPEQLALYRDVVEARAAELAVVGPLGRAPASRAMGSGLVAALDDPNQEFRNTRIDQAGQLVGDFVQEVDFPGFVRDLLKGVFDANLEVTIKQMQEYVNLMKAATQAISEFIKKIPDDEAMYSLAEANPDFKVLPNPAYTQPPPGTPPPAPGDPLPPPQVVLGSKDGTPLDMNDNVVKAKILEAKIAMAQEQRALLRETILMGITRLVVEKGVVRASCEFNFRATENIQRSRLEQTRRTTEGGGGFGGGLFGFKFGGSGSTKSTRITMTTAAGQQSSELTTKLTGFVEITFKSDYFKLDNFAEMYGKVKAESPAAGQAPAPGQPGGK